MYSSLVGEDLIPVTVTVDDAMIRVAFNGGLEIATPVNRFPRLMNARPDQRSHWRLIGRGDGIHWPEIDEDISVRTLLSMPRRKSVDRIEQLPQLIGDLLRTTQKLNDLFDGRPFTPDGQLVGSIGVVVAEYIYGLKPEPFRTSQVAAFTEDGRSVQVKLTGETGSSYGFRWLPPAGTSVPDLLIALKLTSRGFEEVYNGLFPLHLLQGRSQARNGQLSISLSRLKRDNQSLLPVKNSFASLNVYFVSGLRDIA